MTDHDAAKVRAMRVVLTSFVVGLAGVGLFVVTYLEDMRTEALGLGLLLAFGGVGYGLTVWAHRLMPAGGEVEHRDLMHDPAQRRTAAEFFEARTGGVQRRGLLGGALAGVLVAIGGALVFPFRSLGPHPGDSLRRTDFSKASHPRLVTEEGRPVHRDDLPVGAFITVFPDGYPGSADAQTLLLRLDPEVADLRAPTRTDWMVDGFIAYSKICTHAGCPVGEYQVEFQTLFCPCHQSAFLVEEGARPSFGPAVRPLPQLPLAIDEEGYLIAQSDYQEAVGPGWWTRPRGQA